MKDKYLIDLTLRLFKAGQIEKDYAVDTILEKYSNSRRFNFNNFQWGITVGFALTYILLEYVL